MKLKNAKFIIVGLVVLFIFILLMSYKFGTIELTISKQILLMIELFIILIGVLLLIVSIYIVNKKDFTPEKAFLYIVPIFCIIVSAVIPVGRGHDEYMHWLKSYEVSEGTLFTKIYEGKSLANVPEAAQNIIIERSKAVFKYIDNFGLLDEKIDEDVRVLANNQNAATYCFIQYIPQAMGIIFGKLFTKVPLLIAYFGRTFNIVVCIILMYFAIKNIPFGKNIMLALSIIPITIEGFSTLSADGITISIACFFIAYTFKMIFNKEQKCGIKEIAILTISGAILALCKFVYMPIVFLVLLIPKEKFKNRKEGLIAIIFIILVAVILNLGWLYFGSTALVETDSERTSVKLNQILTNPILYGKKLIYTFDSCFNDYFLSCFGGQLEWNEVVKMNIVPYVMLGLISLATISEPKLKNLLTRNQTIIILLVIIAIIGLIFTSIFLQWSTSKIEINGVQGRYFIPILPLILVLAGNIKINTKYKQETITKLICIIGYIVMLYTAVSIVTIHI